MRQWWRLSLVISCAAVGGALPAHADPGRAPAILCYVWANNPTASFNVPYSPSPTYSYNFVGRDAANTVTRTAVGTYVVTCKGVGGGTVTTAAAESEELSDEEKASQWGAGGHVQVTAYGGEDSDYCKVVNWATGGADFTANVKCFNFKGKASDNRFDLVFMW